MKQKIIIGLIALAFIATPVFAKQLWEYGAFSERAEMAVDNGIVEDVSEYQGTLEQNVELLFALQGNQSLGATIPKVVALWESSLQARITSDATTMTLVSGTDKVGNALSGTIGFIIDEGLANEEFVICTAAGTALSGCSRGIDVVDGKTEVTALQETHRRGATVKITNYPQLAILSRILNGDETLPGIMSYASSTSLGFLGGNTLITKTYVDDVGAGGFTASNIGTGLTLRANGTAPETMDINTSTYPLWFDIDSSGYFGLATSTIMSGSASTTALDTFWNDRYNATTTKNSDFTFSDDLTIGGDATTTGNATTTGSFYAGEFCDDSGCSSNLGNKLLYSTSTTNGLFTADSNVATIFSFTIPANSLIGTNQIVGKIPFSVETAGRYLYLSLWMDSTLIATSTASTMNMASATGTIEIIVGAKDSSSSQTNSVYVSYLDNNTTYENTLFTGNSTVDMTTAKTFYLKGYWQTSLCKFKYNNAWFELKR